MRRSIFLAACIGAAVVAVAPMTLAGDRDDAAAEVFRAGSKAYARGEYRAAALAFEAAFREVPHAASAYNAARAWERAGDPARAADLYRAALDVPRLTDEEQADATARVAALEPGLGVLWISAGAVVSVAHVSRARAPLRVHLPPGEHEVRLELPDGREERRRVRVAGGERVRLTPAPPAHRAAAAQPGKGPVRTASAPPADDSPAPGLAIAGWVTLVGAAALAGTAVALGVMALDARDEFDDSGWTDQSLYDEASTLRTWTNVAWVGSGVLGLAGGGLLVASWRSARTSVGVGPGAGSIRVRF
jgi:tetratricopeptide (TPR) repeat protein